MALPTEEPTCKLSLKDWKAFDLDTRKCAALDATLIRIDYEIEIGAADVCFHLLDRVDRSIAAGLDLPQLLTLHNRRKRSFINCKLAGHFVTPDKY